MPTKIGQLKNPGQFDFQQFRAAAQQIHEAKQRIRASAATKPRIMDLKAMRSTANQKTDKPLIRAFGSTGIQLKYSKKEVVEYIKRSTKAKARFRGKGQGVKAMILMNRIEDYKSQGPYKSRWQKSVAEIRSAQFFTLRHNLAEFAVNPSKDSQSGTKHRVQVRFEAWDEAMLRDGQPGMYDQAVAWAMKQGLSVHCDCDDWRYHYAYLATQAGFGIVPETGFPKIMNPHLQGSVCIHIYKVLREITRRPAGLSKRLGLYMKQQAGEQAQKEKQVFVHKGTDQEAIDELAQEIANQMRMARGGNYSKISQSQEAKELRQQMADEALLRYHKAEAKAKKAEQDKRAAESALKKAQREAVQAVATARMATLKETLKAFVAASGGDKAKGLEMFQRNMTGLSPQEITQIKDWTNGQ